LIAGLTAACGYCKIGAAYLSGLTAIAAPKLNLNLNGAFTISQDLDP
jgi:hypothetical protein